MSVHKPVREEWIKKKDNLLMFKSAMNSQTFKMQSVVEI